MKKPSIWMKLKPYLKKYGKVTLHTLTLYAFKGYKKFKAWDAKKSVKITIVSVASLLVATGVALGLIFGLKTDAKKTTKPAPVKMETLTPAIKVPELPKQDTWVKEPSIPQMDPVAVITPQAEPTKNI